MAVARDGRRRFRGELLGREGEAARIRPEDGAELLLPIAEMAEAKLVLTETLIAAALKRGAGAAAVPTPSGQGDQRRVSHRGPKAMGD
jgi:ribosome maturation factor RimP